MKVPALVLAALGLSVAAADAQAIRAACLGSDRGRGQARLCACIQKVADGTLGPRDQRRVARFFTEPDRAQETRRSDRAADERFWERYEVFGAAAEALCRRQR